MQFSNFRIFTKTQKFWTETSFSKLNWFIIEQIFIQFITPNVMRTLINRIPYSKCSIVIIEPVDRHIVINIYEQFFFNVEWRPGYVEVGIVVVWCRITRNKKMFKNLKYWRKLMIEGMSFFQHGWTTRMRTELVVIPMWILSILPTNSVYTHLNLMKLVHRATILCCINTLFRKVTVSCRTSSSRKLSLNRYFNSSPWTDPWTVLFFVASKSNR